MKITDQLIEGKANLEVYCDTLIDLASNDNTIIAVTSDSRGSSRLIPFAEKYPEQIVEVGIAEQNLVGVAAGIASTGKKVFVSSPGCFLSTRSLEQIKNDVAYSNYPVNLVGISSGVSYGALGTTHHSLHDMAVLRAINNITLVVPADNFETRETIKRAAGSDKPFYIKFGKKKWLTFIQIMTPSRLEKLRQSWTEMMLHLLPVVKQFCLLLKLQKYYIKKV